jgi:hypothetical protein
MVAAILIMWLRAPEAIVVRAVGTVPLFDPNSLAGAIGDNPKELGVLRPGEELQVVECVDRKSDLNVHANYQGQVVAVGEWEAQVVLSRHHAYPWEHGAITSCRGLFEHISTHA